MKISVFNQADYDALLTKRAADAFFSERESKSYSARHPELGRMINCWVCDKRHRSSRVCVPAYGRVAGEINDKDEVVIVTKRQRDGAAAYKGKRILRHRNKWGLQVIERTTLIYREHRADPYKFTVSDDDLGKQSLSRALNEKRAERAADRKARLERTKQSRKINREC